MTGCEISLKGSVSSQYITALLLVAPVLPDGLTIHITDTFNFRRRMLSLPWK
ncbi:MAG: hypothetical protein HC908_03700 [Calothrix sp. SM1_7_51]|nr:hypothetical protein [Calothrix sp. SM1_7_51]